MIALVVHGARRIGIAARAHVTLEGRLAHHDWVAAAAPQAASAGMRHIIEEHGVVDVGRPTIGEYTTAIVRRGVVDDGARLQPQRAD